MRSNQSVSQDDLHVSLPLDATAPAAARALLESLHGRIAPSVMSDAQLVVTELVTNSVRHSGVPDTEFVEVSVALTDSSVRVEVADPGRRGTIAPQDRDLERTSGFGLNLIQSVAELWGLERAARGGTRVWAQLQRRPPRALTRVDRSSDAEAPDGTSAAPRMLPLQPSSDEEGGSHGLPRPIV